jgi:hypothetical protein
MGSGSLLFRYFDAKEFTMSNKIIFPSALIFVFLVSLACSVSGGEESLEPATATPDTQATVDAAIAATATAQAAFQDQVDTAVEATITAMPPPQDHSEVSEEELATQIDQAVDEAAAASEQASTAAAEASSDGAISQEEYEELAQYVSDLEYAIALAEELIYAYYDLYGELASETLYLLEELEGDLDELAAVATELVEALIAVEDALGAGLEVAVEVIEQLESGAANLEDKLTNLPGKSDNWLQALGAELEARSDNFTDFEPTEIAGNRKDALLSAFDYIDAVRDSFADSKFTLSELSNIAQLGANAQASLEAQGGPQLQKLGDNINDITSQLARGQMPQAMEGLGQLEGALGQRPSR